MEKVEQGWRRVKPFIPWALGGLVVLAGLILVLIYVPKIQVPTGYWLNPKVIFDMENEARRTLAYIIGGLLVFIGIILTFWQIRILGKQLHVAQEGQITERFTRAIEQLGSKEKAICLGGIYALERIAWDSDRDYWPIMETLTAYVRDNASWRDIPQEKQVEAAGAIVAGQETPTPAPAAPKPTTEIQAVLTVLGRRKYRFGEEEEKGWLDLRNTNLRGADLREAHLEGAALGGAHLERAFLREAHLEGAMLMGAHLEGAFLSGAHLEKADLAGAHLEEAILRGAYLERAILEKAHLEGADLSGAHLDGAFLSGAHLEGANLTRTTGLTRERLAGAIVDKKTILP